MKGNKHMKTITSFICVAFALLLGPFALLLQAQAVVPAPDGVSLDDNPSLALQNDADSTSPEFEGRETRTVLGLYNPSTLETRIWYMNNNVHVGTVAGPRLAPRWRPVTAADFNGDGHIDVLFFNTITRRTWIGYLGGTQLTGEYGPTLPSGWQLVGTADFNHDGHPDFVLYNSSFSSRQTAIWYMNNNVLVSSASGPTLPTWRISLVAVSDFNGNGYADYLLFDPFLLQTGIWYMHNNVVVGGAVGPSLPFPSIAQQAWALVGATDFNHDGRADVLLYKPFTRETAIAYNNNWARRPGPSIPSGWNLFAP